MISKIVYFDGDNQGTRAIKGQIIGEDEVFLTIRAKFSTIRIAKKYVVKVETGNGDNGHDTPE